MAVIQITEVKSKPYDIVTVDQFAGKAGVSKQGVYGLLNTVKMSGETVLDVCYPFPTSTKSEDENTGPKFVVMNEKATEYLESKNSKSKKK